MLTHERIAVVPGARSVSDGRAVNRGGPAWTEIHHADTR